MHPSACQVLISFLDGSRSVCAAVLRICSRFEQVNRLQIAPRAAKPQIGQPHRPVVSHSPELPHVHIKFSATHPRCRDKQQAKQRATTLRGSVKPRFINRKARGTLLECVLQSCTRPPPIFLRRFFVSWLIELSVKLCGHGGEHECSSTCGVTKRTWLSRTQKTLEK